jgi:hypothetical protein
MSERCTFVASATVTVDALGHDVWAVWVDVNGWSSWDSRLAGSHRHGNFRVGEGFTLTPTGGEPVEATLVSVTQGEEFTDEVTVPGGTVRTQHRVAPLGQFVTITHEVRAEVDETAAEEFGAKVWPGLQARLTTSVVDLADVVGV